MTAVKLNDLDSSQTLVDGLDS
ncbi:MAG: hypothetical protein JWO77_752, partial [Ilumatobacteraceae bacterium]|nr:hypothetical protein [Ilumatobacteraceae bacterium]